MTIMISENKELYGKREGMEKKIEERMLESSKWREIGNGKRHELEKEDSKIKDKEK